MMNISGDVHFGSGIVNFGNDVNDDNKTLTESREYRQLFSVASLQHKLSHSLEYDLDVLPTSIANQSNAVSNKSFGNFRRLCYFDIFRYSTSWPKVTHKPV